MAIATVPGAWTSQSPVFSRGPATISRHTIASGNASKNGLVSSPMGDGVVATFTKGEQVQVFSKSRQEWVAATIDEAFHTDCVFDGYDVKAGTLLVKYSNISKYVLPEDVGTYIRKVGQAMPITMTSGTPPVVQQLNTLAGHPRASLVARMPAQTVQGQATRMIPPSNALAPAPVAVGVLPVAAQQPNVVVQPVTANPVATTAPAISSSLASLGEQPLAISSTGSQIPGTVITKTTMQKMFIPADPSQPPMPVGNVAEHVVAVPSIAAGNAAANVPPQASVCVPVRTNPTLESVTVPARSGPMARTLNARPANHVCGESFATIGPIVAPVEYGDGARSIPIPHNDAPIAAPVEYGDGARLIPIPHDDGTGRTYVYVPDQNMYQLDNQLVNEIADELPEGYYHFEDRNGMYQMQDGYGVYQGGMEIQQCKGSFYAEDQQFAADIQAILEQHHVGRYNLDPCNDLQEPVEYLQNGYGECDEGADVAAGIPRPVDKEGEEALAEDQFTRLLNSLEARVDLMSMMQSTRAEIQKHALNMQGSSRMQDHCSNSPCDSQLTLPGVEPRQPPLLTLEPERPFSDMVGSFGFSGSSAGRFGADDVEATTLVSNSAAHLVREQAMLREEVEDQRGALERLCDEVQGMRQQLQSIATEPPQWSRQDGVDSGFPLPAGTRVEARWMKDDNPIGYSGPWVPGYLARSNQDGTFHVEYDNGDACTIVPADCIRLLGEALAPLREDDPEDDLQSMQYDDDVKTLQVQLNEERSRHETSTQQWWRERRRLIDELQMLKGGCRRAAGSLPAVDEEAEGTMSRVSTKSSAGYFSAPCTSANRLGAIAPFCQNPCGSNIELSQDGYTAKRSRGCRQSVVISNGPLELQELGYYFEVVVRETVKGWVGGLGLGVTRTTPAELKRMPDKAWRIPNTFIVGYWGCLFLDGREKRTHWKADTLKVGSRVGFLITGDGRGDLIVFVDGDPVVKADGVLSTSGIPEPLYPVIDVFAATLAVELQAAACAPTKPWVKEPSPPESPASVARSVPSSTTSVGRMSSMGTSLVATDY